MKGDYNRACSTCKVQSQKSTCVRLCKYVGFLEWLEVLNTKKEVVMIDKPEG